VSEIYQQIADMVAAARRTQCSFDGCSSPRRVRHLCENHYASLRRKGVSFSGQPFVKPAPPHLFIVDLMDQPPTKDCVVWPFTSTGGYGTITFKAKIYRAHKIVCEQVNGPKPGPKMEAAHECGNSLCCNPGHLSWKTHADNIADKVAHGTALFGERHHQSRLTEQQVIEIRDLRGKVTRKEIAKLYGVGRATVDNVIDRATWTHI
jgi:hypothetical protein